MGRMKEFPEVSHSALRGYVRVRACVRMCVRANTSACALLGAASQLRNSLQGIQEGDGDFEFKTGESTFLHLRLLSVPSVFEPAKVTNCGLFLKDRIWDYACLKKNVYITHIFYFFIVFFLFLLMRFRNKNETI